MSNQEYEQTALETYPLKLMQEAGALEIAPFSGNLEDKQRFTELSLTKAQAMHLSALVQQVPTATAAGVMSKAYTVKFPEGLPQVLTELKQGGFSSIIRDNGRIVGHASFYEMTSQAVLLSAFSAMSIATSQYFLVQINKELKSITQKLDSILEFLYGDKKAELMSEVSFVRYAYDNYSSIMLCDQQRIATITSIQESRKIAMKDIEFYLDDLYSITKKKAKDNKGYEELATEAIQTKECLELSKQLYVMSGLLEVFYAQNQDPMYLRHFEKELSDYLDKCDKRTLIGFNVLSGRISEYKPWITEKKNDPLHDRFNKCVESLEFVGESELEKAIHQTLQNSKRNMDYYLDANGKAYIEKAESKGELA